MATHSSILAWEIPGAEETGGATVRGVAKKLETTEQLSMHGERREQPPYLRRAEALRSCGQSDSARLSPGSHEWGEQSSLLTGLRSQRCCSG